MSNKKIFSDASPSVQFPKEERDVLSFWDKEKIFEKSLHQTKGGEFYSFYDGPPFATGLPHYGHILAGVLKDIVPRYWTMKGRHVPRYFGWDCHGVPVEYEINKQKGIKSSAEVKDFGIANYNEACRSIVHRYTAEWEKTVKRMGRWVDMKNGYQTMDLSFMQSVWWVFGELWKKGLIYEGYKVVPYSIGISTPLSNFEASQNYKMVQDPAITVRFQSIEDENTYFLAWTTTPWTLPSNLALAVGNDMAYVRVQKSGTNESYYLAEALLENYKSELGDYTVLENLSGKDLVGKKYHPLFSYFEDLAQKGAFKIISSDHVTTDAGTGIVHMAPAFGEDDFFACQKAGLPIVNPVDDDGKFTGEVPDYQGKMVKDADKEIIARLKTDKKLFRHETLTHSYPHCERTDTPLIYRAVSSWFVNVEKIKEQVIQNNKKTKWVPDHLRDGRFGKWLENARDWAISRNRFWGTPIPIWRNDAGETICVGSVEELERLSGKKVKDLHIHFVDQIEIPSQKGGENLKRIGGVLDCWFESGSMPVAQWGYPYDENRKDNFEKGFPAEFIAEGLDQTRGWFYTLMIISTALFDQPAFKNVVVNGIILAEDGRKMSKRLRNYPDPMEVMDQYGADAMRLYLIDSPVVKAQDLKFSEKGVKDVVRKILLRWWNAYSFFVSYGNIDQFTPVGDCADTPNILDQWILSRMNSLTALINAEMREYRLYNVVPSLLAFIEELTNTYIRFNRRHFWKNGMPDDKRYAYETLYHVLLTLSKLMAPFTPFTSEITFRNLRQVLKGAKESVHLESYPLEKEGASRPDLEGAVKRMEQLCLMGRNIREKIGVKGKIPLKSLTIYHRDQKVLDDLKVLESYFVEELNVRKVIYRTDEDQIVDISTKANFPALGPRLGKKMGPISGAIKNFTYDQILALESGKSIEIQGESIEFSDVEIRRAPKIEGDHIQSNQYLSLVLDPSVDQDQVEEGLAREIVRKVQMARKNAQFELDDRIRLHLKCEGLLKDVAEKHRDFISQETLSKEFQILDKLASGETYDIDGQPLSVAVEVVGK